MKKLTLLTLALGIAGLASAQVSNSTNQTVTLTLQNKIEITVEGSPTGNAFTFDDVTDYTTGLTNIEASEFRVRSNQPFNVSVAAQSGNFTSTAATTMPSTVLGVRLSTGNTFTNLTTAAAPLTTGGRGGNNLFKVDYKADPGFSYDAGAYTLVVVYTATQQ